MSYEYEKRVQEEWTAVVSRGDIPSRETCGGEATAWEVMEVLKRREMCVLDDEVIVEGIPEDERFHCCVCQTAIM